MEGVRGSNPLSSTLSSTQVKAGSDLGTGPL